MQFSAKLTALQIMEHLLLTGRFSFTCINQILGAIININTALLKLF